MDIDDFVEAFADQFEAANPNEFTKETNFKDLSEWSSLTVLSIISMIKLKYGVSVSGLDVNRCTTVADVFALVEQAHG
jgi:acyl carrier protein